jgi:hypothetical protein
MKLVVYVMLQLTAMFTYLQARGRYASLTRDREPHDPELVAAKHTMQEIALVDAIEKALAKAPTPMSDEVLARIIALCPYSNEINYPQTNQNCKLCTCLTTVRPSGSTKIATSSRLRSCTTASGTRTSPPSSCWPSPKSAASIADERDDEDFFAEALGEYTAVVEAVVDDCDLAERDEIGHRLPQQRR